MSSCKFLKPGILTTVQDSGRRGLAYYAVPSSGVMDLAAAQLANTLVGNLADAPLIEFNLSGATIQFDDAATIALTGADMNWKINDQLIHHNETTQINAGDVLKGSFAKDGQRSYLAIKGSITGKKNLGSYSSYGYANLGYNEGNPIQLNHILEWTSSPMEPTHISLSKQEYLAKIPLRKGPEYNLLTSASKELLSSSSFSVSSESNRMGARLHGEKLETTAVLTDSVAVLPGFIQLTPSGQLIVILQDGQTTGGYPRVAYIKQENLNHFNQLRFNQDFSFSLID